MPPPEPLASLFLLSSARVLHTPGACPYTNAHEQIKQQRLLLAVGAMQTAAGRPADIIICPRRCPAAWAVCLPKCHLCLLYPH